MTKIKASICTRVHPTVMRFPMRSAVTITASVLLGLAAGRASAQQQPAVPIRDVAPINAKSATSFGNIFAVRPLQGGKVLVNDGIRRQLVTLDADLAHPNVIIDSTSGGTNYYGPRSAPLIPYVADSSLFVDGVSLSLLVIDPRGQVARVMAAPKPADLTFLAGGASGVDDKGRLIYRAPTRITSQRNGPQPPGPASMMNAQFPDSVAVVRADFDTRQVDTIGRVKLSSGSKMSMSQGDNGKMVFKTTINPLVTVDEWAVLSEGSVAFIRGHDYHIDWLRPDGTSASTAKLPFDWKRLTDEDKQKLIDSARTAQAEAAAKAAADKGNPDALAKAAMQSAAGGGAGGGQTMVVVRVGSGDMGGGGGGGGGGPVKMDMQTNGPMAITPEVEFVPIKEIADYYPAIRPGAAKADLDGNLWILPTTSAQSKEGELVYDVVTHTGDLLERVRMPVGRSIAGFGHGGILYLMWRDQDGQWYLERTRIVEDKRVTQ